MQVLRDVGAIEKSLRYAEFLAADKNFTTGNFLKVARVTSIDEPALAPGRFSA